MLKNISLKVSAFLAVFIHQWPQVCITYPKSIYFCFCSYFDQTLKEGRRDQQQQKEQLWGVDKIQRNLVVITIIIITIYSSV